MTSPADASSSALPSRRSLIAGATAGAAVLAVNAAAPSAGATTPRAAAAAPGAAPGSDRDAALTVARAILVRDENDKDLIPGYREVLLGKGLPRTRAARKKVLVVGAGPAGLTAARGRRGSPRRGSSTTRGTTSP